MCAGQVQMLLKSTSLLVELVSRITVFSPGFFEGVVGGGAGIRARRWVK